MNVLIFGAKGYLSNSILFDKKKKFKVTLLSKNVLNQNRILDRKFDLIIHTLGANKFDSEKKKKKTSINKRDFTTKILRFAEKNRIRKIIYISSMNIYLKKKSVNLKNNYVKNHILTEQILKKNDSKNIKILILRISHLFGIRDNVKSKGKFLSIVNNLIKHSFKNKPFLIKNKNAVIDLLPLSFLITKLDKLLFFKYKYKIIDISFLSIKIIPLIKIISHRLIKKLNISPKVRLSNGKYLNLSKSEKLKKYKSHKLKKFIKEVDELINFYDKSYN